MAEERGEAVDYEITKDYADYTLAVGSGCRHKECPGCIGMGNSMAVQVTRKEDGFLWVCHRCRNAGMPHYSGFIRDVNATPSQVLQMLAAPAEKKMDNKPEIVTLPEDFTNEVIAQGLVDMYDFDVRDRDMSFYNVGYSAKHGRIIFPCYKWGQMGDTTWSKRLIGWAGKKLSTDDNPDKPKWHIVRQRDVKHLNYTAVRRGIGRSKQVVIVEDPISAIRVADAGYFCIGLLTTYFPDTLLPRLKGWTVHMWLDDDALDKASKYIVKIGSHGIKSHLIYTTKDPKEYTNEDIKTYVDSTIGLATSNS
jgi:hypothetical protein